jgi:hypothetical protein
LVVQHRFPLLLRKLDPETSISTPVPTRLFHRGSDYSHPRNLYSHPRNPYSHPPGIFIHIAPESVSTCPGIRTGVRAKLLSDPLRRFPAPSRPAPSCNSCNRTLNPRMSFLRASSCLERRQSSFRKSVVSSTTEPGVDSRGNVPIRSYCEVLFNNYRHISKTLSIAEGSMIKNRG